MHHSARGHGVRHCLTSAPACKRTPDTTKASPRRPWGLPALVASRPVCSRPSCVAALAPSSAWMMSCKPQDRKEQAVGAKILANFGAKRAGPSAECMPVQGRKQGRKACACARLARGIRNLSVANREHPPIDRQRLGAPARVRFICPLLRLCWLVVETGQVAGKAPLKCTATALGERIVRRGRRKQLAQQAPRPRALFVACSPCWAAECWREPNHCRSLNAAGTAHGAHRRAAQCRKVQHALW